MSFKWPLMKDIISSKDKEVLIDHIKKSDWLTAGPKLKSSRKLGVAGLGANTV